MKEAIGKLMDIRAQLELLSLPNLLQLIATGAFTGVATIVNGEIRGKLAFQNGRLVLASSSNQIRLGGFLVDQGALSGPELEQALESQRSASQRRPLATVLLEEGFVDADRLEELTSDHVRLICEEILTWKQGTFYFEAKVTSSDSHVLEDGLSTDSLLLAAAV